MIGPEQQKVLDVIARSPELCRAMVQYHMAICADASVQYEAAKEALVAHESARLEAYSCRERLSDATMALRQLQERIST